MLKNLDQSSGEFIEAEKDSDGPILQYNRYALITKPSYFAEKPCKDSSPGKDICSEPIDC